MPPHCPGDASVQLSAVRWNDAWYGVAHVIRISLMALRRSGHAQGRHCSFCDRFKGMETEPSQNSCRAPYLPYLPLHQSRHESYGEYPPEVQHSDWPARTSLPRLGRSMQPREDLDLEARTRLEVYDRDEEPAWWIHRTAHAGKQLGTIRWYCTDTAATGDATGSSWRFGIRLQRRGLIGSLTSRSEELVSGACDVELAEVLSNSNVREEASEANQLNDVSNDGGSSDALQWIRRRSFRARRIMQNGSEDTECDTLLTTTER